MQTCENQDARQSLRGFVPIHVKIKKGDNTCGDREVLVRILKWFVVHVGARQCWETNS